MLLTFIVISTIMFTAFVMVALHKPDSSSNVQLATFGPMATFGWVCLLYNAGWLT